MTQALDQVDYNTLDAAKRRFIEAAKRTLQFASAYGGVPSGGLGGSANAFSLNLASFLDVSAQELFVTLVPEGLGTADDARPDDLSEAELRQFWWNIGIKIISCLTNDAASSGMQTVLLGLYLPSSTPETVFTSAFLDGFLDGVVEGCRRVGCVYISGETPQLKTKIIEDRLDIAGSVFGIMPPGVAPIDGSRLSPGNTIVLVESTGLHENGFTPVRKLAESLPDGYRTKLPSGKQLWEAMNAASHLYTPLVQAVLREGIRPTAMENITGHGWQKLMRSAKPLRYVIDNLLPVPEIFQFVESQLAGGKEMMLSVFNYGAGFAFYTETKLEAEKIVQLAQVQGLKAAIAGRVEASPTREVVITPFGITLEGESFGIARGA
ncbi:phosphoribosylformylglycinamidine cyclo-ligase [Nostoc sp. TCL26-01]|uniref:AIR synthase related protein n=1 Tax=Nostoc sp. TCL26-01 TaxID=2576904 RepID=UPI0015B7B5AE|nr:phosphoribosylformylglycinamidine cyclo-ligase [Nostoc sp. TCL26-01]QLE56511.1 phosphoribosylformylglycinamidine cyclo-ligase [Nostoc sp. TCL26-01]